MPPAAALALCGLCLASAALPTAANVNLQPRQRIPADAVSSGWSFAGDSRREHFRLLERDGHSLLVGARNAVYNLSLPSLGLQKKLEWAPSGSERSDCERKGESGEACQNFVRVLVREGPGRALVCGTNAFNPRCRLYALQPEGDYRVARELEGTGLCPYDPAHNSTATFLAESGDLFAATVTDRAASDPLIYRRSLRSPARAAGALPQLRTQRYDLKTLNRPDFVSSFVYGDYVYFWFREVAVEAAEEGQVFARVGRVCATDKGGPSAHDTYAGSWTTFLKARLNCSLPATYFDRLEATSQLVTGEDGSRLVYAVLSTPPNALQMSAVCAFRMQDVAAIFDTGAFLAQGSPGARWAAVPDSAVPRPRPGLCTHNSRRLSPAVVKFANLNSLMARPVPNHFARPLYIDNSLSAPLTQVAVDEAVEAVSGRRYHVIFVGSAEGRVRKLVTVAGDVSVLVEEMDVFQGQPVRNLIIHATEGEGGGELVAVSESRIRSLPLAHCERAESCGACVRLQDPYCAWDLASLHCRSKDGAKDWPSREWVQSVPTGRSSLCPEGDFSHLDSYAVNDNYALQASSTAQASRTLYSPASMSLAIILTLALALGLGLLLGLRLSSWKKSGTDSSSTSSASDYQSHSMGLSRLTRHDAAAKTHHLHLYSAQPVQSSLHSQTAAARSALLPPTLGPPGHSQTPLGTATLGRHGHGRQGPSAQALLSASLHVPPGASANPFAPPPPEKNSLLALSNGTLPKDYRVKKVYL